MFLIIEVHGVVIQRKKKRVIENVKLGKSHRVSVNFKME